MKKILSTGICFLAYIHCLSAQNLSQWVTNLHRAEKEMEANLVHKILLKDDRNGYLRAYTILKVDKSTQENYTEWGLWKTAKGNMYGAAMTQIFEHSQYQTIIDERPLLTFYKADNEQIADAYDAPKVYEVYQNKLKQIQARGAEGTETFFAEMPKQGTTIRLYIVYGSELTENQGIPKWKIPFGELQLNKTTSKLKLILK
jgi:hypothetical protein